MPPRVTLLIIGAAQFYPVAVFVTVGERRWAKTQKVAVPGSSFFGTDRSRPVSACSGFCADFFIGWDGQRLDEPHGGRHLPVSTYEMSDEVARAAVMIDAEMHAGDGIIVERSALGRRRLVIEHPEGYECRVKRLVKSHDPDAVLVQ